MMKTLTPAISLLLLLCGWVSSCSRSAYPCPDIRGGTEVVKPGSTEGLKKPDVDIDANGRLSKKPYSHSGVKKKK